MPKNTNLVKGGASSQIQVSPIRKRRSEILFGKLYNRKFLSSNKRILVSKACIESVYRPMWEGVGMHKVGEWK